MHDSSCVPYIKYGLIVCNTENLGDDLQALSSIQLLPKVDVLVDRDSLKFVSSPPRPHERVRIIMNGYYTHKPKNWLPPPQLHPLFISFHISPLVSECLLTQKTLSYLKNYRVGCRDIWTKTLLGKKGVKSYFSGCLTLTLKSPDPHSKSEEILLVDLDGHSKMLLPPSVCDAVNMSNELFTPSGVYGSFLPLPMRRLITKQFPFEMWSAPFLFFDYLRGNKIPIGTRLAKAKEIVNRICSARLVLTSRLHVALTSVAVGTPVIFVNRDLGDPRFTGLLDLMNHYSLKGFREAVKKIDWDDPPENPNPEKVRELKEGLTRTVTEFLRDGVGPED